MILKADLGQIEKLIDTVRRRTTPEDGEHIMAVTRRLAAKNWGIGRWIVRNAAETMHKEGLLELSAAGQQGALCTVRSPDGRDPADVIDEWLRANGHLPFTEIPEGALCATALSRVSKDRSLSPGQARLLLQAKVENDNWQQAKTIPRGAIRGWVTYYWPTLESRSSKRSDRLKRRPLDPSKDDMAPAAVGPITLPAR